MIFRIYDDNNAQNINTDGWAPMNTPITSAQIQSISSADSNDAKREITSIPSPWGRLDLIRTAFRNVVDCKNLQGVTLDYKLVSDTLDVAQICFHLKRFSQQGLVEKVRWDREGELNRLTNSTLLGHRELARTWSKYLAQDTNSFNFNKLEEIAIFKFVHPQTHESTVIGGGSPTTLFYPAPGDLSHIANHVAFGQDRPFDGNYTPLSEREEGFVVWLYALREGYAHFTIEFKELSDYLDLCKPHFKPSIQAKINQLHSQSYRDNYSSISYQAGQPMHILRDLPILVDPGNNTDQIGKNSDFVIQTNKSQRNPMPLVLPITQGWSQLFYVSDKWDTNTRVEEFDASPIERRILPGDGSTYPYLTIGDFLEDKLIKLKNSINASHFYPGDLDTYLSQEGNGSYLLPLKPLFFEFFSVEEFISKKMLQLRASGDTISVQLNIPIKGGVISYTRCYEPRSLSFTELNKNSYTIEEIPLELGLIHTHVYSPICYVLPEEKGEIKLEYLSGQSWQAVAKTTKQDIGFGDIVYSSAITGRFEALRIQISDIRAVLIPRPKQNYSSSNSIEYAIDLGTSNTCIAYRINGSGTPALLTWDYGEMTSGLTKFDIDAEAKSVIESHLSLNLLGKGLHKLPLRTALFINKDNNAYEGAMLGTCPSLNYQFQDTDPSGTKTITNIKWSNTTNDYHLEAYIYGLCVWLRKHADNLGIGTDIKITWLYPSSMPKVKKNNLQKVWTNATKEIFGSQIPISSINEAIAPYLYLTQNGGVSGRTVAMDIGGGTVDVLLTGSNATQNMHLTSFRFGANILYTAPSNMQGAGSGFARMLRDYLQEHTGKHSKISSTIVKMDEFIKNYQSDEAVDKFFSLAKFLDEQEFKGIDMQLDNILQDDSSGRSKLRSAVLLYFVLQVYHIAGMVQNKGLERPNGFVFSGNGSRILSVLGDTDLLSGLITRIFNFVESKYEKHPDSNSIIDARFNPEPKEATTYGAVVSNNMGIGEVSPEVCIYLGGNLLLDGDNSKSYQVGDEQLVYNDLVSFSELFYTLESQLRLVKDWGYDRDSLNQIQLFLEDKSRHKIIFESYVRIELEQENGEYSQSPFFSFMGHAIKDIVYELYPQ